MAVYVTVVDPTSKKSPLAWVLVKDWTSQLSSAEGSAQVMSAPHCPASLSTLTSALMPLIEGTSLSVILIMNSEVLMLP